MQSISQSLAVGRTEPIQVASAEQRPRRPLRRRTSEAEASPTRDPQDSQDGIDELRRILQGNVTPSPFLVVSPPTRCTGALNPQPRDRRWRTSAQQWCNSNLQALRELDARGTSFLTPGAQSEETPSSLEPATWHSTLPPSTFSSGRSGSSCASSRLSTPPTRQTGFVIS